MKNSTSILLTGLLATGCASLPPMRGNPWDRDVNYVIEEGKETDSFEGKSDFTVVVIPDKHSSYGCQANAYLTLEKCLLGVGLSSAILGGMLYGVVDRLQDENYTGAAFIAAAGAFFGHQAFSWYNVATRNYSKP